MINVPLAKLAFRLSGGASKITTYRQTYKLVNEDEFLAAEGETAMKFEPAGRSWQSIRFTWTLLSWAGKLGGEHFDHFALDHTTCAAHRCEKCKGWVCSLTGDDEN